MGGLVHEPGQTVPVSAVLPRDPRTKGRHRDSGQEARRLCDDVHRGRSQ